MDDPREEAAANRFLVAFHADREEGRELLLADYQPRFPGFEERIAREHARLVGGERPPAGAAGEPRRLGPYRLLRELGRGGQGTVWEAEDTRVARRVALKLLPPGADWTPDAVARLRREAGIAARLAHPGICTVYEADFEAGRAYVAMRLVEGETLQRRIERAREDPGLLPVGEAARLVEEAACALAAAHGAGIVHRDVKPGNVMLTPEGGAVVLDFGLARDVEGRDATITLTGDVFGTPAYMAPEQIEGRRADARADVWALGVTLYEALALEPPFRAPTREALYREVLTREPAPPSRGGARLPRDLAVLVATALSKDPARRYAGALDLAGDLAAWRTGRPIAARPVSTLGRLARWSRREPRAAGLVAALGLALAGAAGLGGYLAAQRGTLEVGAAELARRERGELVRDVSSGSFRGTETVERLREVLADDAHLSLQRASLAMWLASPARGRAEEALELLDAAPVDQENPRAIERARVFALRQLGLLEEAAALEEELGTPANSGEAFLAAAAAHAEGNLEGARRAFEMIQLAVFFEVENEAYLEQLIRMSMPFGADDTVARAAHVLETRFPDSPHAWFHIALGFSRSDEGRSYRATRKAIDLGTNEWVPYMSAHAYEMDAGDLKLARETFERGLPHVPEERRGEMLAGRARMCCEAGSFEEALEAADRALALAPDSAEARDARARALRELGRGDLAPAAEN